MVGGGGPVKKAKTGGAGLAKRMKPASPRRKVEQGGSMRGGQ
jgi:hypothetical protein